MDNLFLIDAEFRSLTRNLVNRILYLYTKRKKSAILDVFNQTFIRCIASIIGVYIFNNISKIKYFKIIISIVLTLLFLLFNFTNVIDNIENISYNVLRRHDHLSA